MCKKCKVVKNIDDFQLYVRQNELDICKTCNTLKKVYRSYKKVDLLVSHNYILRCPQSMTLSIDLYCEQFDVTNN